MLIENDSTFFLIPEVLRISLT